MFVVGVVLVKDATEYWIASCGKKLKYVREFLYLAGVDLGKGATG